MALLQVFPKFQANMSNFDKQMPLPRGRKAETVIFRSGGDLKGVVAKIMSVRMVAINAAPGAGKSTVLPLKLAEQSGGLVIHVLPYEPMSASTNRFVSTLANGVSVKYMKSVEDDYPSSGLVHISAACLVARWLQRGEVDLPKSYVLQDESHESGVASAVLQRVGSVAPNVMSFVSMTATSGPTNARPMETGGEVDRQTYEAEAFEDPWSIEESGAPWSVESIDGHALLFEDDKKRAIDLVQAYNYSGMQAYRLHYAMSVKEFFSAYDSIQDENSPSMTVLIADSTFRSGYTFPVSTIVDSGLVKRVVCGPDGKPTISSRPIYEFEYVQSAARGGRLKGLHTAYWRPKADMPAEICDLGQTDVEALALIFRVLGYRVPECAAGAKMRQGLIPKDLCIALQGKIPLACIPDGALIKYESGDLDESGLGIEDESIEQGMSVRETSAGEIPASSGIMDASAAMDMLSIFAQVQDPGSLELGKFYAANGLISKDLTCSAFPHGADSVRRIVMADGSRTVHHGWSPYTRSVAVTSMLHSYNTDLLAWMGWMKALTVVRDRRIGPGGIMLRDWAARCAETITALGSRTESTLGLVEHMGKGFCEFIAYPGGFDKEVEEIARMHVGNFDKSVVSRGAADLVEPSRVRDWVQKAVQLDNQDDEHVLAPVRKVNYVDKPSTLAIKGFTGYPRPGRYRTGSSSSGASSFSSGSSSGLVSIFGSGLGKRQGEMREKVDGKWLKVRDKEK